MIVDRYDPVDLSELIPELRLEMEPELAELDRLLDDDVVFNRVKLDLSRRYPNSGIRGRHSTPVEVILRMLVVRRLYNWSYEQTERNVSDSLVLRQFCRLYLEPAPDDTTLIRWARACLMNRNGSDWHPICGLSTPVLAAFGRSTASVSTGLLAFRYSSDRP